jgi:hypothetical protein
VAEFSDQLRSIDIDDVVMNRLTRYDMKRRAPDFKDTFTKLLAVMTIQETKLKAREEKEAKAKAKAALQAEEVLLSTSTSSTSGSKRPRPESLSLAPKRSRGEGDAQVPRPTTPKTPEQPKTPDQPTEPSNLKNTGSSVESKAEPSTNKLLDTFLMNTLSALDEEFTSITWQNSSHQVDIVQTYIPV